MKLLLALSVLLLISYPVDATIKTHDLSSLEGRTLVPFDGLNSAEAILEFGFDVGFDVGETGFEQFELHLNFSGVDIAKTSELVLLLENNDFESVEIPPITSQTKIISYYGLDPVSLRNSAGIDVGSRLSFGIMFNDFLEDGFEYAPTDMITFGSGSYIRITDEEEGLFPHPIPETGTFSLFLLGAVGLCVRRQMKQQA